MVRRYDVCHRPRRPRRVHVQTGRGPTESQRGRPRCTISNGPTPKRPCREATRRRDIDRKYDYRYSQLIFVFGVLLLGRWRFGWRGRRALYWILAGTALLVLGYLGSKFVAEILLGR